MKKDYTKIVFIFFVFSFLRLSFLNAKGNNYKNKIVFLAVGIGKISPGLENTTKGIILGKKAAISVAYRNLAKKMYESEVIKNKSYKKEIVSGIIKGAKIIHQECNKKTCKATLVITNKNLLSSYLEMYKTNKILKNEIKIFKKKLQNK